MSIQTVARYVLFFSLGYTLSLVVLRLAGVDQTLTRGRRVQHVESPIPPDLDDARQSFPQHAQRRGKNHEVVRQAFSSVGEHAKHATVLLLEGDQPIALGTVVQSDGWILSKASELSDDTVDCLLPNGNRTKARKLAVDNAHDLAVLKLDNALGLEVAPWSNDQETSSAGGLVFSTGSSDLPIAIGIISVPLIDIPRHPGVLGIRMKQGSAGATVLEVLPGGAAEVAGLKVNDTVLSIDDNRVLTVGQLGTTIREYWPGDRVRLTVQRDKSPIQLEVTLGRKDDLDLENREFQHELGGPLSTRRSGFGKVIQHDTVITPEQCGGPLVDIHGRVVGINIARAERISTYAIPAVTAREIATTLIQQAQATIPASATRTAP